ncbi:MAG: HAMP domain-containing histidine kinase [Trueperaceae bacterium]|nr:HAMP domain-containing histidine kinase [Trueperaceae bacterium]
MLRFRLSLLLIFSLLLTIVAFGFLADSLYYRLQLGQAERFLERDLARVQTLVENSTLGTRFVESDRADYRLQFVSSAGQVIIPLGEEVLPFFTSPSLVRLDAQPYLVASLPWRLPSGNVRGSIRLALDVSEIWATRRILFNSLAMSAAVIVALALFLSLSILRRALTPLQLLATKAEAIDPAKPELTVYDGPNDEVATLAKALDRTLAAIRERQEAERDALAEIAHELAAPLSVVAGQLSTLAQEKSEDSRFVAARDAANELLYTSQDLLTLARGELEFDLELAALDLGDIARKVAKEYPGVQLEGESAEVLASEERMTQVVRNLVRNAVQACGQTCLVKIKLEQDSQTVKLHVIDQGPGIDEYMQKRIFERYYSKKRGGTGVGLVVAKKLVDQHEGSLSLKSEPGKGSCFTISLPSLESYL